ncbi:MAG TPA: arginine--tRNA ligase [Acidobacteriaceae bacterium]|nr:arginine--tRNA ligase [Acidobacteriaceae bacterium]
MYKTLQRQLLERVRAVLRAKYDIEPAALAVEQPPKIEFGEYALPVAFELARTLRKAPRKIAEEIVEELGPLPGFARFEVAGAGYINCKLDRSEAVRAMAAGEEMHLSAGERVLVEHTSINPNKAAHIGHLRNAILGDTFMRLLMAGGYSVAVQNYIDNTGVQVADVVVGLMHLEGLTEEGVAALLEKLRADGVRIDFYLWDLYARVSQWYEAEESEKTARKKIRLDVLHEIERGGNATAAVGEMVSNAVLHRHLETMERLDIEYDFLPRESEILHLHFWDAAFEELKAKGVVYLETEGKNKGCWVMRRAGNAVGTDGDTSEAGPDEDAKIIVRSNGTVTYVGKDIAYHLWKFGLLPGKSFGYRKFHHYKTHTCWISAMKSEPGHPHFGGAKAIYNVIDSRQADPQNNVIEALRGMGYTDAADHYTHFSYEMVALTPRCAQELGYEISEEDAGRPFIEVSGRKGFGVKADDLLDRLIAAAQAEVSSRHPELDESEQREIAAQIAIGALRYFMLKFTKNTVIAFDFREALSFEGETGPYAQYACVRAANIFRKANIDPDAALATIRDMPANAWLESEDAAAIWEVWLSASKLSLLLQQAVETTEPAYLAKYVFQLAQQFNNFYHRHHILTEEDSVKRALLLATAAIAQRELTRALSWMGVKVPAVM